MKSLLVALLALRCATPAASCRLPHGGQHIDVKGGKALEEETVYACAFIDSTFSCMTMEEFVRKLSPTPSVQKHTSPMPSVEPNVLDPLPDSVSM